MTPREPSDPSDFSHLQQNRADVLQGRRRRRRLNLAPLWARFAAVGSPRNVAAWLLELTAIGLIVAVGFLLHLIAGLIALAAACYAYSLGIDPGPTDD